MVENSYNIRPLTAAENNTVQTAWIGRMRRNIWLEGVGGLLFAALALKSNGSVFFIFLAVILIISCLGSSRILSLITHDLNSGSVEEIIGSVRAEERGVGNMILAFLGPVVVLIGELVRLVYNRAATRGPLAASLGSSIVLIRAQGSETISVDSRTYGGFRDGTLVKAVVLPQSRVALNVKRASLGDH